LSVPDIIARKRQGLEHSPEELEALVLGHVRGEVPDYQVAAWLMAVCFQGLSDAELAALTRIMAHSGTVLDLSGVGRPVADKHSTGGVGDKTSLVALPLAAACAVPVGKMSGRGLSFTGGTVDKLESIPGMHLELSAEQFLRQLREVGIVISGQSADLAPADGKLYALRDVTATVSSIPLIAASVMSKKLAGGAHCIVLDVKAGRGAFMASVADARRLAEAMIAIGTRAGRRVAALVTDMSQPLGLAVGNALEVREAIDTLSGRGPADLAELACTLAAEMVCLATGLSHADAHDNVQRALASGAAREALGCLIQAQGGDQRVLDEPSLLPGAPLVQPLLAWRHGYVAAVDALAVADVARALGAGRARKGDPIDPAVGVVLAVKVGQHVERGQPLATLHASDGVRLPAACKQLAAAFQLADDPAPAPPLIHARLGAAETTD
jgi:pyrimidine-nucleoside phosphorylase